MGERTRCKYVCLSYQRDITSGSSVPIAVVLVEEHPGNFASIRAISDWSTVLEHDPEADLEYLVSFMDQLAKQLKRSEPLLIEQLADSLSNTLCSTPLKHCLSENPEATLESLASEFFTQSK